MANYNPNSFKYVLQDESVSKVCREVHVSFKLGKNTYRTFVFVPKKEGQVSKSYYVDEAKKEIDRQIKSGELIKNAKLLDKKHPYLLRNVLITAAFVAVAGASAATACHFLWNRGGEEPVPPEPILKTYKVSFDCINKDCTFNGGMTYTDTVKENSQYTCIISPDGFHVDNNEVFVSGVVMNGNKLTAGDDKDYTFKNNKLTITKPTDGDISIFAFTRPNSFNVYCTPNDRCKYTNFADTSKEAPTSVAQNSSYKCKILPKDPAKDVVNLLGVTMSNMPLTEGTDYTFSDDVLTIDKPTTGNIVIIAIGEDVVKTTFNVYHRAVGCTFVGESTASSASDYVCTITANDATNDKVNVVSVAVSGVSQDDGWSYNESTQKLTINKSIITGEISIAAVAVKKTQETCSVKINSIGCTSQTYPDVNYGYSYTFDITANTDGYAPRIAAVVMGGLVIDPSDYFVAKEGKVAHVTITVKGDLYIFAVEESVLNATKNVAMVVAEGCDKTAEIKTLSDGTFDGFEIAAADPTNDWVNIVAVNDSSRKLYAGEDYIYSHSTTEFKLINHATGDLLILAKTTKKASTKFPVNIYKFDCEFEGSRDAALGSDYTAKFTASNPTIYQPSILGVVSGGNVLTLGTDYTFTKDASSDEWNLKINKEVIEGDIEINVVAIDKDRASYKVACYTYGCTFLGTNSVASGAQYVASPAFKLVTPGDNYVIEILSISMGNRALETSEYSYNENVLKILTPATGDIMISALAHERNALKAYGINTTGARDPITDGFVIDGLQLPSETNATKAEVTEVEIPSSLLDAQTGQQVPVTAIEGGLLNGCSALETLTIPFIGGYKNGYIPGQENPEYVTQYTNLFGYIFGSRVYEGVGALTWQDFYNTYQDPDTYKITKTAIPYSLKEVIVTNKDAVVHRGAFSKCRTLESITFESPEGQIAATKIGSYAFNGCTSLKTVEGLDNVKEIEWQAFADCTMLQTFNAPVLETIHEEAFNACVGIRDITLSSTVQTVKYGAFTGIRTGLIACVCTRSQIAAKDWDTDWVDNGTSVIYGTVGSLTIYTSDNNDFRFIAIKDDAGTQGAYLAEYLGDEQPAGGTLTIPHDITATVAGDVKTYNVLEIGAQIFYAFQKITTIQFNCTELIAIGNYAFTSCVGLTTLSGIKNTKLQSIGDYAFDRCTSLVLNDLSTTTQTFPSTLNYIGAYGFAYCDKVESIDFSNCANLIEIHERLFYQTGLKNIKLPTKIAYLGEETFAECKSLQSLEVSVLGVTDIPDSLCKDCTSLTSFTWTLSSGAQTLKSIGNSAFDGCSKLATLKLCGKTNALSNGITNVGDYAFRDCVMSSFTFGNSVKTTLKVGVQVFQHWTSSQTLYLSSNLINGWAGYDEALEVTYWGWTCGNVQSLLSILSNEYRCGNTGSDVLKVFIGSYS